MPAPIHRGFIIYPNVKEHDFSVVCCEILICERPIGKENLDTAYLVKLSPQSRRYGILAAGVTFATDSFRIEK